MTRLLTTAALVVLSAAAALLGYRFLRAEAAEDIYRDRLQTLARAHADLADRYNSAVRQTAVTELLVTEDAVSVRVRDQDGAITTIPTPYSPEAEIYADYAVKNGRLWIRRVFDDRTAPANAVAIDPALANLDWAADDSLKVGKAVYRGALEPGVYTIAVTGSGALGITKSDQPADLQAAPPVADFTEIEADLDARLGRITLADVWGRLFSAQPQADP